MYISKYINENSNLFHIHQTFTFLKSNPYLFYHKKYKRYVYINKIYKIPHSSLLAPYAGKLSEL